MKPIFLSMATALAVALSFSIASPTATAQTPAANIKPANFEQLAVQQAYQRVWTALDSTYANRDKLSDDWAAWRNKFDGKLYTRSDLSNALDALLARVGDPSVRLLGASELAAAKASEVGGQLGFGVIAKRLPVYGPTALINVTDQTCEWPYKDGGCNIAPGQGYKDGLRTGDVLIALNGQSIAGLDMWTLHDMIRNSDERPVFTIKRSGQVQEVAVHPTGNPNAYGLDISIEEIGVFEMPHVFAMVQGPAKDAGIAESDVLEAVNGKSVEQMTTVQLKALSGSCNLGDTLRLKVRRLQQEVTIPCGLVPALDSNMKGSAGGMGSQTQVWQYSLVNLDDPRIPLHVESFLAEYTGSNAASKSDANPPVVAVLDLRGATGTRFDAAAKFASFFMHNGTFACLTAGWRDDQICTVIKDGVVTERQSDGGRDRIKSMAAPKFPGPVVVVIDDNTSGTALLLAGALRNNGAKLITYGEGVRMLPDYLTEEAVPGDPLARTLQFPIWHFTFGADGNEVRADEVVRPGREFEKAGQLLGLSREPYNMRQYD